MFGAHRQSNRKEADVRTLQDQVGDVTVARSQRRLSKGQLAASVIGAVVVGVVAGWISYVVLSPSEVTSALTPAEIASVRAADMVTYHESQWLSDPVNVAAMSPQQVGELRSAAMVERLAA